MSEFSKLNKIIYRPDNNGYYIIIGSIYPSLFLFFIHSWLIKQEFPIICIVDYVLILYDRYKDKTRRIISITRNC